MNKGIIPVCFSDRELFVNGECPKCGSCIGMSPEQVARELKERDEENLIWRKRIGLWEDWYQNFYKVIEPPYKIRRTPPK